MKRRTAAQCWRLPLSQDYPVLLCERDQPDGNWEDLLIATAELPAPPNLIVFSRLAAEALWANVPDPGGFDVLITPFEAEEVLRVTSAAWSRWESAFAAAPLKEPIRRAAQQNAADAVASACRAAGGSA